MSDAGVELLDAVGDVSIWLAETATPWDLEIDSLVISVGSNGVGQLGESFLRFFPSVPLYSVDLSGVSPTSPLVVPLTTGGTPSQLSRLVLASVRETTERAGAAAPDLDTVTAAAAQALWASVNAGGRRVGLPLLGAGVVGLRPGPVARAIAIAILPQLSAASMRGLESLVLFDIKPDTVNTIRTAWRDAIAHPTPPAQAGDAIGTSGAGGLAASGESEPPVQPPENVPLSDTARMTLIDAAGLARASNVAITPQLLWYTALQRGRTSGRMDVAVALINALTTIPDEQIGDLLNRLASVSGVTPSKAAMSPSQPDSPAVATLRAAVPLAARVNSPKVRQRHLLAAAALDSDGAAAIERATGWPPTEARRQLRSAIAAVLPQEFPDVWDAILIGEAPPVTDESPPPAETAASGAEQSRTADPATMAPVASGPEPARDLDPALSEDAVPADARIPISEDSLDLDTYVTMLAAAIAREDTPLPLSIGLFGEWGSGKSYFMGLLRGQIETFEKSDNGAYLTGIEQITFNAWHYTDANLWASLASTIFERLGRKTGSITDRRQGLVHQLEDDRSRARRVQAEAEHARLEEAELGAELHRRRTELAGSGATLLTAVQRSTTVHAAAQKAWRTLGIESLVEQQELLAREAQGLDADWFALRRAARGRRAAVLTAVVSIALVLLGVAAFAPANVRQWLTGGSSVALLGVLATGLGLLERARSAVHQIASAVAETQAAALQVADEKLKPLHSRVDIAAKRATELATAHDELVTRISKAEYKLSSLDPSRRWYDFVAERAASPDYQRQLGLISIIRRDFEQLISLMKDWRKNPTADRPENRPINRIVLYIDDLDRCSPKQVMDVLQAVHLILALDLFVVVVGVDPRWLLQSLRQQYRDNFSSGALATSPADAEGWTAEPLDYLEKIFNIPFVLPRMTADSFKTLIEKISSDSDRRADRIPSGGAAPPTVTAHLAGRAFSDAEPPAPGSGASPANPDQAAESTKSTDPLPPLTAERGSEVAAALRGKPAPGIGLTSPELTLLAALGPVVESPREAKRLLNVYRTLRSLRAVGSTTDFLHRSDGGGDYQALGILLGVLSANPALLGRLLWAPPTEGRAGGLSHRSGVGTWATAAEGLRPRSDVSGDWSNDLGPLSREQCLDWTQLLSQLSGASALVELADLRPFQVWGPYVARFSFVLSPLAATIVLNTPNSSVPGPQPA